MTENFVHELAKAIEEDAYDQLRPCNRRLFADAGLRDGQPLHMPLFDDQSLNLQG